MRKKYIFGKKLYISVLTSILVLLTTVATTFAWVGVFANSTFETFNFDLKASHLEEYGIEISVDGINFKTEISFDELKPQILKNFGYENVDMLSDKQINALFDDLNQDQCTTIPIVEGNSIKQLGDFVDIRGEKTTKLIKFDIYISAVQFYDKGDNSNFKLDVFLNDGLLVGTKKAYTLMHSFRYPSDFINPYDELIEQGLITLPEGVGTVKADETILSTYVDSSSCARIAFEKYKVVEKYHPEQYDLYPNPNSAVIYQDSYEYPIYDNNEGLYSFGGIVPDSYNLAVGYYNSTEWLYSKYGIKAVSLPDEILNTRSVLGNVPDVNLSSKTNQLINQNNLNEQIGTNQMMKMSVYFWFEGWDADCFPAINHSRVNINIGFVLRNEEEFE